MQPGLISRIDDVRRLRILLAVLFLALAIPTGAVIWQAYGQLKWEAFHQARGQAEALLNRINDSIAVGIQSAESQGFAEYSFLNIGGDPQLGYLQRSPLSSYPVEPVLPGLIGYFQVDSNGRYSTPLLPDTNVSATALGISEQEYMERQQLAEQVRQILVLNQLSSGTETPVSRDTQELFDELRQGARESASVAAAEGPAALESATVPDSAQRVQKVRDLRLDDTLQKKSEVAEEEADSDLDDEQSYRANEPALSRSRRMEQSTLPELLEELAAPATPGEIRITTFESEVDPFEFSTLDTGELVLYRNVWREGERLIQGFLLDRDLFVNGAIIAPFDADQLSAVTDLVVGLAEEVIRLAGPQGAAGYLSAQPDMMGNLLFRSRLVSPMDRMELIFSVSRLPAGPGARVLGLTSLLLIVVFGGGFLALYRLGIGQIRLARQQQDFVASVSHELKTPLTSIRMYSEMLREGWTSEEKKQQYYEFIHDESERLSRLISNVLQLASITRNEPSFDLQKWSVSALLDQVKSRIASQVTSAGFELVFDVGSGLDATKIQVDEDCMMQIVINLVDNAIKFSNDADDRRIVVAAHRKSVDNVRLSVRDFGPGIPRNQIKKIFRLFYRPESELTRETVGTGIGLAIVHQLTVAMGGRVDVLNRDPGAEFGVTFPLMQASQV